MTRDELKYHIDETELDRDLEDSIWVNETDVNEYLRRNRDEELMLCAGVFRP